MRRSIRDYLVTLCLGIFIFTVVAFFLIRAAEGLMVDVVDKIGSEGQTQTEEVPETQVPDQPVNSEVLPEAKEDQMVTFLVMGLDLDEKKADSIFLVGINATKKKATVSLIPSNTVVPEGTRKDKLGELYSSRSINFYKEFVKEETGIDPDYYMVFTQSGISNLVDFIGGISCKVPENMQYMDSERNFKIDLAAGKQTLSGDKAIQLLNYYGYQNKEDQKREVHLAFANAFCSSFLVPDNFSRFEAILYNIRYHMKTDFEEEDLKKWNETIFNFGTYAQDYVCIPGAPTGDVYYAISTSRATSLFENYQ